MNNTRASYLKFHQGIIRMLGCLSLVFLILLAGSANCQPKAKLPERKNILVLFANNPQMPHDILAMETIINTFEDTSEFASNVDCEYLDLKKFSDEEYEQKLRDVLSTKYLHANIDLVLIAENSVLKFWLKYRDNISPNTITVAYDINSDNFSNDSLPANVIRLENPVSESLPAQWILKLWPDVDEIVVVCGSMGEYELQKLSSLNNLYNEKGKQIKLTNWSIISFSEMKLKAATLPSTSIIFYLPMFTDIEGDDYSPEDVLKELCKVSAVPVLSNQDQFIGTGSIGGYMHSIEQTALLAAQTGLRILRGESVENIRTENDSSNKFIFDHAEMLKFNIPESNLPPGSIIKNRQYSVYETHRNQIVTMLAVFTFLILMILVFGVLTKRLYKAQRELLKLNTHLESLVSQRTENLEKTNIALSNEIEERKQAEGNLVQLNEQLSNLVATKNKVFSVIAHDLRSPFNSIMGFTELLIEGFKNKNYESFGEYLQVISSSTESTLTLLDNLLNWAKSQTGQLTFEPQALDLSSVIYEIIEVSNPAAEIKNIGLNYCEAEKNCVYADQNILHTVLRNLISNAIKFTNTGGRINIFTMAKTDLVEIIVSDNGVGMDEETMENLFNQTANVSTNGTENEKGSGLGLMLCKEFVEKNGGKIWLTSMPGKGSSFVFTIPKCYRD